jgi:hypothetical protein
MQGTREHNRLEPDRYLPSRHDQRKARSHGSGRSQAAGPAEPPAPGPRQPGHQLTNLNDQG